MNICTDMYCHFLGKRINHDQPQQCDDFLPPLDGVAMKKARNRRLLDEFEATLKSDLLGPYAGTTGLFEGTWVIEI